MMEAVGVFHWKSIEFGCNTDTARFHALGFREAVFNPCYFGLLLVFKRLANYVA